MLDVSDLIGIPYKEHGRDKDGYDCYGLVIEVEKRIGVTLPDFDYIMHSTEMFDSNCLMTMETGHVKRINDYIEGGIILFKNSAGMKHHIGVYLSDGMFVHCDYHGVSLKSINGLENKIAGVYVWQE